MCTNNLPILQTNLPIIQHPSFRFIIHQREPCTSHLVTMVNVFALNVTFLWAGTILVKCVTNIDVAILIHGTYTNVWMNNQSFTIHILNQISNKS